MATRKNICLLVALAGCFTLSQPLCLPASSQLKPVLKAIDPSLAKTDVPDSAKPQAPPSPNPLGNITGAPVSPAPKRPHNQPKSALPSAAANPASQPPEPSSPPAAPAYPPQRSAHPDSQPQYPSQQPAYSPQQPAYPPQQSGYPPAYPPQQAAYPPPSGYRQQTAYPPSSYPPQQAAYPPPGYPQTGYPAAPPSAYPPQSGAYPSAAYPPQQPAYGAPPAPTGAYPSESMIPDFGQPLPTTPQPAQPTYPPAAYSAPAAPPYGQHWSTQPPSYPQAQAATPAADASSLTPEEQRITRLELIAFGSAYPEHEDSDRLDHLEKEVFGSESTAGTNDRLSKLEAKLAGRGAFTQTASAVAPPAVAMGNSAAQQVPARAQSQAAVSQPRGAVAQHGIAAGAPGADFQSVVRSIPEDKSAGDFFSQIRRFAGGSTAHWTSFPIKIRLPQDCPQSWKLSLESAAHKWGQYLPVKLVSATDAADVDTVWTNHLPPGQLGITRTQITGGKMQVVVYLLRPTYYPPNIPERILHGVYIHELGHSLGIFGHSDKNGDAMEPVESAVSSSKSGRFGNITPRDLNTLKHIYESPPLPPDFTIAQPMEWGSRLGDRTK